MNRPARRRPPSRRMRIGGRSKRSAARDAAPPSERVATVERLGHRGDGLVPGGNDLPAAHVAGVLPGETIRLRQSGDRGELVAVLTASPDRIEPPCPHFGVCGGCQLQHLAPDAYRAFKCDLVRTAFAARGLPEVTVDIVEISAASRRRAVLKAARTRGGIVLGLSERRGHAVTGIRGCLVLSPRLMAALPALERLMAAALGPADQATATVIDTGAGLDVAVSGRSPGGTPAPDARAIADAAAAFGAGSVPSLGRVTVDDDLFYQSAPPAIMIDGVAVPLPPGAFLQASAEAERAMAMRVVAAADGARRIADLFCGLGTFSLPLSEIAPVHAVDGDPALTGALAAAPRLAGRHPVTTETRDLMAFPLTAGELSRFDVVAFDPPRAGAAALSTEIARSGVPKVVAVSCNPATLARDLATLLAAGFKITQVSAIDQFVHAAHIEVVVTLERSRR